MQTRGSSHLLIFILAIAFVHKACGQSYDKLGELKGYRMSTYYSAGAEIKANRMATQLNNVITFYDDIIHFAPSITLLVLSPSDWATHAAAGAVYGMPHYTSSHTLIVASENNPFWKSFIPPVDKIPKEFATAVTQTYSDHGELNMEPFFDLLAIHELGHAYHIQDSLTTQRRWMGELLPNILLHTYIEEREPELLQALTVFPRMVVATTDRSQLKYTTLEELQTHYNEVAQKYPRNYGWYQCRWHMAAAEIYAAARVDGIKKLWPLLKKQRSILNDEALAAVLEKQVHPAVADVMVRWDEKK